ncbi:hypothetical protein J6590_085041 [Homalodisca vitripennis]|nr:hypothetical protein J6590_085041 [Homalodisca vitripennis]
MQTETEDKNECDEFLNQDIFQKKLDICERLLKDKEMVIKELKETIEDITNGGQNSGFQKDSCIEMCAWYLHQYHPISHVSPDVVEEQLELIDCTSYKYALHAISNAEAYAISRGSHWSLMIHELKNKKTHHFDSVYLLNRKKAEGLSMKFEIGMEDCEERPAMQQTTCDSGYHVMANAVNCIDTLRNKGEVGDILNSIDESDKQNSHGVMLTSLMDNVTQDYYVSSVVNPDAGLEYVATIACSMVEDSDILIIKA